MSDYYIRKIVVPVDLSETSLNALDTAVLVAKKQRARLCLLNVVEPGLDPVHEELLFSSGLSTAEDVLNALAGAIQHANDITPEVIQTEGNVVESVVRFAIGNRCDLIIMGTHGASGYREGFIGTNAYSVIKYAPCPVLTIPPKRKFLDFKRVLFPVRPVTGALMRYDVVSQLLSVNSSMDVLGLSYRKMEQETNVLDKIVDEIKTKLVADKTKVSINWNRGTTIPEDILRFSQENLSDLIVVTSLLDVTTKPGFIGPHSQKIMNASKLPVLNIKKLVVPSWV